MSNSEVSTPRSASVLLVVCMCLCLITTACAAAYSLPIKKVFLQREAPGASSCDVIVEVHNTGTKNANNVTVRGQVKQFDVNHTVNNFDSSDFGGSSEIAPGNEKTFIGRSVVIPPGVAATYTLEVWQGNAKISSRGSSDPITCPA
jgi:hypothetical protein